MKFFIINKNDDFSKTVKEELERKLLDASNEISEDKPDYVISVGGDGTLLNSLHKYEHRLENTIFVGVHTGKLGFLCNYLSTDIDEIINCICGSEQPHCDYDRLIQLKNGDKYYYAINEVRIESPYRTMSCSISINGKLLENYHGNGLNFSTSLGASGYNYSLNGPLINPKTETIIMCEIAGISHNAYHSLRSPLVLDKEDVILIEGKFDKQIIGCDHLFDNICNNEISTLEISMSNKCVKMLNSKQRDYFDRLRSSFIAK